MFIEIIPKIGGTPLRIEASQLLIRNTQGTPVGVAGEFGGRGDVKISHAADADFNRTLRAFGYHKHFVKTQIIDAPPPPPGARLVAGPDDR